jgi:hypothetical protein
MHLQHCQMEILVSVQAHSVSQNNRIAIRTIGKVNKLQRANKKSNSTFYLKKKTPFSTTFEHSMRIFFEM